MRLSVIAGLVAAWTFSAGLALSQGPSKRVLDAEKKRVETINKIKPAVVAVMGRDRGGNVVGNGSGVLIDDEGYALTNFHVTSAIRSPAMKCGLPDGELYDAVLVGLDPVGDIALIKLLPKKEGQKFPFVKMGDSDKVKPGDWSLCLGNPFGLAYDFTPTVTFGMVSATNRFISIGPMEYTNCLQVDTSINPGNSGGPLFNLDGELIGINSAISIGRRARANSGVGFCVSINQIKNFLGSLRVGLLTDHASLGAVMESESEDGALSKIIVRAMIECDAQRRGLEVGDQLISFAGRRPFTVNQFKNLLGQFPRGWRVPMVYARERTRKPEILVRLMGVTRREIPEAGKGPKGPAAPPPPPLTGPAAKLFKAKPGFANYYFNELAQQRLLKDFAAHGDFSKATGDWTINLGGSVKRSNNINGILTIREKGSADKTSPKLELDLDGALFPLEPLSTREKAINFKDPQDSGGLVLAMYHYRQLLVYGAKGFNGEFYHGGVEPFYPPTDAARPDWGKLAVMTEVFITKHVGVPAKWHFALEDDKDNRWKKGQMIGFEVFTDKDGDPCEVCLSDYKDIGGGRKLPGKVHVRYKDQRFADLTINSATIK